MTDVPMRRRRVFLLIGIALLLTSLAPLTPWISARIGQQTMWAQTKHYSNDLATRVGAKVYEQEKGCGSSDGHYSVESHLTAASPEDLQIQLRNLRVVLASDGWTFADGSPNYGSRTVGNVKTYVLIGKRADRTQGLYYVGFDARHCVLGIL